MSTIKPICLINESYLPYSEKQAIIDGINEMTRLAGVDIKIIDNGYCGGVDDIIRRSRETARRCGRDSQLETTHILTYLDAVRENAVDSGQGDRYHVLVLHSDLFGFTAGADGSPEAIDFVIGSGYRELGAVMSTYRFRNCFSEKQQYECLKTEAMHEMGHAFGLIPDNRIEATEESLGKHCTNLCVMRQGLEVPQDWIRMSEERLRTNQALCPLCLDNMRDFFRGQHENQI